MFSIFRKFFNPADTEIHPLVDLHSHLLPGIDDGVKSINESLEILKEYEKTGFKKVITTPHIHQDYYPNTPQIIRDKLQEVQNFAKKNGLTIEFEAAAEYYLDEWFLKELHSGNEFLTIGQDKLLVETSFNIQPVNLLEIIFTIRSKGYKPILAHPERYTYLFEDWDLVVKLKQAGVYFQLNINSLGGFYGSGPKIMAKKLIDNKLIDFVGSDCHSMRHFESMMTTMRKSRYWIKVMALPLKNHEL